jgi:flagellar biogenesis protein FliO
VIKADAPRPPARFSDRPATAGAPTTAPSASAATPSTRPATRPAPAPARSQVDERLIYRDTPRPDPARAAASSAPTTRPTLPGNDLPRVAGALALVLGLIFALRWLFKRSVNPAALPGATNAVQVLTRSHLSPRQQLLLVRVGRRLLVVSDCNGQLNSLSEITDPDEVASLVGQLRDEKLTTASRTFGNLLGIWRGATEQPEPDDDTGAGEETYPRAAPDVPAPGADDDDPDAQPDDDPTVLSARSEIHGLLERVRGISGQLRRQQE